MAGFTLLTLVKAKVIISCQNGNKMDLDQLPPGSLYSAPQVYSVTARGLGQDPSHCVKMTIESERANGGLTDRCWVYKSIKRNSWETGRKMWEQTAQDPLLSSGKSITKSHATKICIHIWCAWRGKINIASCLVYNCMCQIVHLSSTDSAIWVWHSML